jgi:hypothetical protein
MEEYNSKELFHEFKIITIELLQYCVRSFVLDKPIIESTFVKKTLYFLLKNPQFFYVR